MSSDPCNTTPSFGTTTWGVNDFIAEDTGWKKDRLFEELNPLGGGTIVTRFGFKARTRSWEGLLSTRTRDLLQAQYDAGAIATLTDREGVAVSAFMISFAVRREVMLGPKRLWRYHIDWIDRS